VTPGDASISFRSRSCPSPLGGLCFVGCVSLRKPPRQTGLRNGAEELEVKKNRTSRIAVLGIAVVCSIGLTACPHRHGHHEGPAEKVGKTMDHGAAAVGRGVEKTGEAIQGASGH
jgi:hypothetical protein